MGKKAERKILIVENKYVSMGCNNTFSGHHPGRNADLHRYSSNTWIALAGITEHKRLKNKMMLDDW